MCQESGTSGLGVNGWRKGAWEHLVRMQKGPVPDCPLARTVWLGGVKQQLAGFQLPWRLSSLVSGVSDGKSSSPHAKLSVPEFYSFTWIHSISSFRQHRHYHNPGCDNKNPFSFCAWAFDAQCKVGS